MAKRPERELEVIRSTPITEHMLRITLGGEELASLAADQESAYVKLLISQSDGEPPLKRSYTIRHQRPTEIDIDFVLHESPGPASAWAIGAQPGDRITVAGPGPKKLINHAADWFLLAGDMTAIPAISVNLRQLPEDAIGYVVIEVPSPADIQDLEHPAKVELHWEVNPEPDVDGLFLASKVRTLSWLEGQPAVWAACEFNSMRVLRSFLGEHDNLPNTHLYLSSYWKLGQSDEGHKQAKRLDSEQEEVNKGA
ncbi:siderophore-interacting protein [Rhodopirellula bahusiensis]|uniref:NADPH-dependent ferric siderophore reductase n=1 Tax=Rhodopirellula bahusiensis TaxID=2014065 RepID=A0A2G1W2Q2_9BACT|nr:siderophore-interacting protein [Rhodopirellula bahusiensis]PHQ33251.1 NADPH-dependent ferric siderophore reductase [Rhodopirellula bahusiensis]